MLFIHAKLQKIIRNTPPSFLVVNNSILWISWSIGRKIMNDRFFAHDYDPVLLLNVSRYKDFIVDYLLRIDGAHVETPRLIFWGLEVLPRVTSLKIKAFLFGNFNWRKRWSLHFFSYRKLMVHNYLRFWDYSERPWGGIDRVLHCWFLNISNLIVKGLSHWRFNILFLKWVQEFRSYITLYKRLCIVNWRLYIIQYLCHPCLLRF